MSRPITLRPGRWADVPLETLGAGVGGSTSNGLAAIFPGQNDKVRDADLAAIGELAGLNGLLERWHTIASNRQQSLEKQSTPRRRRPFGVQQAVKRRVHW